MWKRSQHLWKNDLPKIIDTLKDKAPSHAKFEDKLSQYHRAATRVLGEVRDVDMEWVRIDVRPLATAVHKEAMELCNAVSTAMRELDAKTLADETAYITQLRSAINQEPDSLEVRTVRSLSDRGSDRGSVEQEKNQAIAAYVCM